MWNLVVNAIAILVIPLAYWIIERKSKRSKLVKDPSDYWEKFHSDARSCFTEWYILVH